MSDHDQPVAANLLNRQFAAAAPNQRWVSDTTEFVIGSSGNDKLHLAAVLELFLRFIVGWAVGDLGAGLIATIGAFTARKIPGSAWGWRLAAGILAIILGIVLAVMRLSPNPVVKSVAWVYLWIFRGTPVYVQLTFWGLIAVIYQSIDIGVPFTEPWISMETKNVISVFWIAVSEQSDSRSPSRPQLQRGTMPSMPVICAYGTATCPNSPP